MAASAFCAIPITWVLIAIVGSLVGLCAYMASATKHTAELSDEMSKLRDKGDQLRATDQLRMERLQQLAEKENLSNAEMAEAEKLAGQLQARYGDLGVSIDRASKSITMATDGRKPVRPVFAKSCRSPIGKYDKLTGTAMSVIETIEAFKSGLMWICLSALAAIAVGVIGAWLCRSARSVVAWAWRSRPWFEKGVLIGLLSFCVVFGSEKTRSGGGALGDRALPGVTAEEIAQGWRLVTETNCTVDVYAMPEGVSPTFNWHKRGTFGEWARLDLGDFAFPLGTNSGAVTSLSVFNDGRIRPTPRDAAREICAVGVPMLAMQGASRFWVGEVATNFAPPDLVATERNPPRIRLTWENFFLHADTNTPVNAQIELVANGDFVTRSNDVERICRRIEPFDWDGDGLENTVDPDPLVAGPDAHGTNAEWYNVVCSNVLEAVGGDGSAGTPRPTLSWLDGVNSNAYYFVDVVTTNGLVPIYFTGDRESRLGNPVVVARAYETNHVPLLIGINYAVTSPVPFSVLLTDDGFASVTTNSVSDYDVRWPLDFVFTERIEESGRVYTVTVEPYDPGGVLTWDGGGMRSGASSGCGCGCLGCVGYSVGFNCSATCTCHGECKAVGGYAFENTLFAVTGGVCRCGFDDPVESGTGTETNNAPRLSVSFSRQAVIFEDARGQSRRHKAKALVACANHG